MKVGFIGLGLMGSRMAGNLIKNNYELLIYNRTKAKAEDLINKGAKYLDSPALVGKEADILITMLSDPATVNAIANGTNGFLKEMRQNSIWIDCSTVNPSFSKAMAKVTNDLGIRFLDAPVAGTTIPAEKGELLFITGGRNEDIEEAKPVLEKMGKKIIHVGENGMGTSMKIVLNLILGNAMAAFSEAIVLGESMGISKEVLLNTLIGGPLAAPFLAGKKEKISSNKFDVEFPLELMYKDLQLASVTAYENSVPLPATNSVKEIFGMANKKGYGKEDFSAVYEFLYSK